MIQHGEVEEKLQRGFALIARSGNDPDLLGMALLAIHGALEAFLRGQLSARQDLTPDERRLVDLQHVSGAPLVALVQRYLGLGRDQLEILREMNSTRRGLVRGDPLAIDAGEVLAFAHFVEAQCGQRGALDEALINYRQARAGAAATIANDAGPPRPRGISLGWLLLIALGIIAMLALVRLGYETVDVNRVMVAVGIAGAPTVTPGPTPTIAPPTPPPRTARVVRLGGAIGWMHQAPQFTSPTLPPRLAEGTEVELLDEQAGDTDGNLWRLVRYNGYDGWIPANNLDVQPPASYTHSHSSE